MSTCAGNLFTMCSFAVKLVAEFGGGDCDHASGAFPQTAATQMHDAVFGDDGVDVGARSGDDSTVERRLDRGLTTRCGPQRDNRPFTRECGRPGEVHLAAHSADIYAAADLGAHLPAQVDLDGEVHRHQ